MDAQEVKVLVAGHIDYEYLASQGLAFGQWTQEGFTLEEGDQKFKVTITEE